MIGELHFPEFAASLRWQSVGEGRPLLVLPALSVPVGPAFSAMIADPALVGRRFLLIDYLGSGASDHPQGFDYSLAAHAATIAAVLDHLGLGAVDVLGHSMGGSVAIQLALDHPRLVGRLAIGEGNLTPGGGAASSRIVREDRESFAREGCARMREKMRQKGAAWLADAWESADPFGVWGNADSLVRLDPGFEKAFLELSLPRSFIYGANSLAEGTAPDVPDPEVLKAAGVGIAIVSDAGHAMFLENPSGSAEAVARVFPME